jgi:hypothetical protein
MKNYLRSALAGLGAGLLLCGVLAQAALGLTIPPTFAPRYFPSQQTHYERHVVSLTPTGMTADGVFTCNWNASTPFVCAVKVGSLPYNAFVVRIYMQVTAACTASTACGLGMGTGTVASGNQLNLMANASILSTTGSVAQTVVAANAGIAVTGNGIAQSGADGGFDLYITGTATVAVPTAGTAVLVLEYFANNDGGCTPGVSIVGGTAPAC